MKKILLIEDNPDIRENTAEILSLANFDVLTAENGKIGVDLAKKEMPDLIICDIMMPELDGFGVLHMLAKNPATAGIPFIFLTAKSEREDFRKGMNLGADDYLTKPFDDLELLDAIEIRLKKNEIIKTEFSKSAEGLDEFMNEARGFEGLNKMLADEKKTITYKKKHNIFSEGSYPNAIYFINKGKVKTFKSNEDGREYITGLYKEGDFIGYTDLLEENYYSESAETLEETELVVIPKQDFFSLVHQNRDVSAKFIKMLANNLIEKEERLLKLAYNSVRKRVAESLIMLRDRYKKESDSQFKMAVSREDLSNIVGASKETVIRTLADFKEEKLVDLSGSTITLLDEGKLEKMRN
ncbi:response regulator [Cytophagaceae bacterium ABcell3]|nr:response regulator [Cytophagaceae bacterium ABcell3]